MHIYAWIYMHIHVYIYIYIYTCMNICQGIIQEFDIWASVLTWASPCDEIFATGEFDEVAVRPRCKLPPILLYITSRFAYMKHFFCWQFILIFLDFTSAWMFFFRTLATAFPTSTVWKLFVLVEFENSAKMHAQSTSFPVLLS